MRSLVFKLATLNQALTIRRRIYKVHLPPVSEMQFEMVLEKQWDAYRTCDIDVNGDFLVLTSMSTGVLLMNIHTYQQYTAPEPQCVSIFSVLLVYSHDLDRGPRMSLFLAGSTISKPSLP